MVLLIAASMIAIRSRFSAPDILAGNIMVFTATVLPRHSPAGQRCTKHQVCCGRYGSPRVCKDWHWLGMPSSRQHVAYGYGSLWGTQTAEAREVQRATLHAGALQYAVGLGLLLLNECRRNGRDSTGGSSSDVLTPCRMQLHGP
jgi:hypothetical protein